LINHLKGKKHWNDIFLPIRYLLEIKHWGFKYHCPICGFHSSDMDLCGETSSILEDMHIVGGGRRKAKCWVCRSRDRERLVFLYLRDYLHVLNPKVKIKILHMAPEPNLFYIFSKKRNIDYTCGDLFTEGYTYPKEVQNMNLLNLPQADNTFDIVLCNHVLEHISEDTRAMSEIFRVLKPGGTAILQVPISQKLEKTYEDFTITSPEERKRVFGQKDHVRIYGQDYKDRLSSVGFNVKLFHDFSRYKKNCLNPEEVLYVCQKAKE
jgi:SAM-dependent methyltransferase